MLAIPSKQHLLELFRDIDVKDVEVPHSLSFPLAITDYFTWQESSGHRSYLVIEDRNGGQPLGMVFEKTKSGDAVPMMCNWCNSVRPSSDVALMTISVNKNTRIGIYLCSDFSCKQNILGSPSINDMRETLGTSEKIVRLNQKIKRFVAKEIM